MRTFVKTWITCSVAALICIGTLNVLVDPYWVFGTPVVAFNQNKTQALSHSALAKTYLAPRSNPATLLVGASRVELGFNPESSSWPQANRPVFNLGIAGSTLKTRYNHLRETLSATKPKLVIMEVTFEDCFVLPQVRQRTPTVGMKAPNADQILVDDSEEDNGLPWLDYAKDLFFSLWSLNAVEDSFLTVLNSSRTGLSKLTSLGFHTDADFRDAAKADGYSYLFASKNETKIGPIVSWAKQPVLDLAKLRQMIEISLDHGASVIVMITPGHADELEMYRAAGIWDRYLDWKGELLNLTNDFVSKERNVALWDFGGFSQYTTEPVPAPGDTQQTMRWYWESNHFKSDLGDLMISRLMGTGAGDFGVRLTMHNFEDEKDRFEKARLAYEERQPQDVRRVGLLYSKSLGSRCATEGGCRASDEALVQGN